MEKLNDKRLEKAFHCKELPILNYYGAKKQKFVIEDYKILKECISLTAYLFAIEKIENSERLIAMTSKNKIMDLYNSKNDKNRHLYEIIVEDNPCLLYLDIDCPKSSLPCAEEELICNIKRFIKIFLNEFYDTEINESIDIITLKSNCDQKLSYHLILRCKDHEILFENNKIIGLLLQNIIEEMKKNIKNEGTLRILGLSLEEQKKLFVKDANLKCVIDTSVYSKNRLFRILGACKKGRTDIFKYNAKPDWIKNCDNLNCLLLTLITFARSNTSHTIFNTKVSIAKNVKIKQENDLITLPRIYLNYFEKLIYPGNIGKVIKGNTDGYFLLQLNTDKYCEMIGGNHKSNRQYITVNVNKDIYWKNCYDCGMNRTPNYIVFEEDFSNSFNSSLKIM